MGGKIKHHNMLLEAYNIIVKSGMFPNTNLRAWIQNVLWLDKAGYLWVALEDNHVTVVAVAYKVKEVPKEFPDRYPAKEEGSILYIPFMISISEDNYKPKKLLSQYLEINPDVTEIAYHDLRVDEQLKRYKRKAKEDYHDRKQVF